MVENDTNYLFKPKSLTIGYDMDSESKKELYNLCKNNGIKVYDLKQGTEGYNLRRIEHSSWYLPDNRSIYIHKKNNFIILIKSWSNVVF